MTKEPHLQQAVTKFSTAIGKAQRGGNAMGSASGFCQTSFDLHWLVEMTFVPCVYPAARIVSPSPLLHRRNQ